MDNKITILYVEDEEAIRENTKRPLGYLCDELILAEDGKDGLKKYKQYTPNIVISDIKMPNMNGIEMVKKIKQINPEQYIIFTTAHSESGFFMEAIDMQVDGYILKPIDYDLLEKKIQHILNNIQLKLAYKQQQEQIIQQKLDILEQVKNAQMGEMLGNIAHQWRQPLSVISTIATGIIIKRKLENTTNDEETQMLQTITKNAQYLSDTINIFRDYIKEEKELKTVILQDRIHTTINLIDSTLMNYHIKLINNIDKCEPISITLVVGELSQVIINILNNAKDILIERDIKNKEIIIDLTKENNTAIITIQDNAGGVPLDIIHKIFDPYFTTKHQSQGTGLGLHMSRDIIEKSLNGKLEVKNGPKGAIFTISLPI